jgi:hypothetical protein
LSLLFKIFVSLVFVRFKKSVMEGIDNPNFEPVIRDINSQEVQVDPTHQLSNARCPSMPPSVNLKNQNGFSSTLETPANTTPPETAEYPTTKIAQKIFNDPATFQLFAIFISAFSILKVSVNIDDGSQSVPSFVVNGASLIYSIFAIFVTVICKNQDSIAENGIWKKIFGGRNIYWHEIHSTATLTLACANLSCAALTIDDPALNIILSISNTIVFVREFVKTVKIEKTFVNEESQCDCKIIKYFFIRSNLFNFFQSYLFIAAFVLYLRQTRNTGGCFFYCSIIGTSISIFLALMKSFYKKRTVTNNSTLPSKKYTYLSIAITTYAFLIVLTNSVDVRRNLPAASPIGFSASCILFIMSLLDLYFQAVFNKSRPFNSVYDSEVFITEQKSFRNLPTIIENSLGGPKYGYGSFTPTIRP